MVAAQTTNQGIYTYEILRETDIQTDQLISVRRQELLVIKKKKSDHLVNFSASTEWKQRKWKD